MVFSLDSHVFNVWQTTATSEVDVELDVCEQYEFRVASVNQFGTLGFSDEVQRQGQTVP